MKRRLKHVDCKSIETSRKSRANMQQQVRLERGEKEEVDWSRQEGVEGVELKISMRIC